MARVWHGTRAIRVCVVSAALSIVLGALSTSWERLSAQDSNASGIVNTSKRMANGKQWTTQNLDVKTAPSYCYENKEMNCLEYGRLYTWESARRGCESLGDGWRLPTEDEWRQLAKRYGGVHEDAEDGGKAAYKALLIGGNSGFDAMLGGGRSVDGQYARLEAHGFYWTATEDGQETAWFYNFGHGSLSLYRQSGGEKQRGFAVRCVRE